MKRAKENLAESSAQPLAQEQRTLKRLRLNPKSVEIMERFKNAFSSESAMIDAALEIFDARYEAARRHSKR